MKIDMAEGDYFNIGSVVSCTTCYGQKVQGEVMAFDHQSKMLCLKSSSGKPNTHDVKLLNLNMVKELEIIKENTDMPPPLTNLNYSKIAQRTRQNIEEKQRQVNYIGIGVTPEGQKVFNAITKTINDVRWDGKNIVVMDQVTIQPPYRLEDCRTRDSNQQALQHVKKIIEKHIRDTEQATTQTPAS